METLHLHVLPLLHIFAKAEGSLLQAICSCNRSAFTTSKQMAGNNQHATTEHLLPCKPFSRLPDLLSYRSTSLFPRYKQKDSFSCPFFPPFSDADTCNKFLFKEADHSKAACYEQKSKGHYWIALAQGTDFSQYPKSPGHVTPSAREGSKLLPPAKRFLKQVSKCSQSLTSNTTWD